MLNPEYSDYDDKTGNVKIGFTDAVPDVVLEIILTKKDAQELSKMIVDGLKQSK